MDPKGQLLAEHLMQALLIGFGAVAFAVGYAMQDLQLMVSLFVSGCVVSAALTLPDWPWYNRNPLIFRPVKR